MKNSHHWFLLATVFCAGCEQGATPPGTGGAVDQTVSVRPVPANVVPALPRPAPAESPVSPEVTPVAPVPLPAQAPAAAAASAPQSAPSAATASLRLSTGVALAQTLPEGTTVLFSMDYQWTSGGAQQGSHYTWVVETGNGKRLTGPANLSKRKGTINSVLQGVRPDQGPFQGAVFAQDSSPGSTPVSICDFINLTN